MARKNKVETIKITPPKPRTGPYQFQGSKCTFDNRPKRNRTRATQKNTAIRDASY